MRATRLNGGQTPPQRGIDEQRASPRRPRTVGHRGASALAPENSLRAIELAIEHGLDLAELDVHLSRDGELMVIHDADLTRVAGRPVAIAELTAAELARIDVGDGRGVPRLPTSSTWPAAASASTSS